MYTLQVKDLELLCVYLFIRTWWIPFMLVFAIGVTALFRFLGNNRSVSFSCGKVWYIPSIHSLVHCLFRELGARGRYSGAGHRTQLWVKHWNTYAAVYEGQAIRSSTLIKYTCVFLLSWFTKSSKCLNRVCRKVKIFLKNGEVRFFIQSLLRKVYL